MGKRLTTEEFIKRAKKIHGDKYRYDKVEYINIRTKIKIFCKKYNKYFYQLPSSHLKGLICKECSRRKRCGKMPCNFKDLSGMVFGRLTVIKQDGRTPSGVVKWLCKCRCGNYTHTVSCRLKNGECKSCGCLQKERASETKFKHGKLHTTEYYAWNNMKRRCYEVDNPRYKTYGARGIKVCDRWLEKNSGFINFLKDMGEKPHKELSLDRINNDKDYTPDNCIWQTEREQSRKKTNSRIIKYNNETHNLEDWGGITGFGKKLIWSRLNAGWSIKDALTKPVRERK